MQPYLVHAITGCTPQLFIYIYIKNVIHVFVCITYDGTWLYHVKLKGSKCFCKALYWNFFF